MIERAVNAIQHMDILTLFGLVAVTLMLTFYTLENRSPLVRGRLCRRLHDGLPTASSREPGLLASLKLSGPSWHCAVGGVCAVKLKYEWLKIGAKLSCR